ncbi:DeoR/GlpR family DNA-binding transcription regulator [Gracilibacillus sp. YIM 98692]|uniref:DeoR/GlpR family DNA-binding transcription regulator n=1 Tax=Gracilibacillus sp. YIM 98692 TaxID=2663532 RepID=UPI0013D87565|nr:DeoR/GlpR family DNA-binding transcription regulator [Gracilibacillus sp. YIM 98692]
MVGNKRQMEMIQFIKERINVTTQELMEQFNVSDMTIRRDLKKLEDDGHIIKFHGGATIKEKDSSSPVSAEEFSNYDISTQIRSASYIEEKRRIASKAVSMIEDGESILLDAGTTTFEIAKQLGEKKHLTVVTNGINIAHYLLGKPHINVIIPGGDMRPSSESLVGPATVDFLSKLTVDQAFIGSAGISLERGFSNSNMIEGSIKSTMIKIAAKSHIVADPSKFQHNTLYVYANFEDVTSIITNKELDEKIKADIMNKGVVDLILS